MILKNSILAFEKAKELIPGGVNSPVRAFKGVGGSPVFIKRGLGSKLWDVDGNEYVDLVGSWGAAILGHADKEVIQAMHETAMNGLSFGAPREQESKLIEEIRSVFPSMEKARLVSSGTEACMSAIRVARASTGRNKILKFSGHYHGHSDALLVKAGSGLATFSLPDSSGVPEDFTKHTLVCSFNNIEELTQLFHKFGHEIACVILEPIVGNSGFIRPIEGFLKEVEQLVKQFQSLLIFDEVITGFRVALGGAQALYNIKPDLTILGKIIGGGMPLAAFGGCAEVMNLLAPEGPVYQAGTLSGNPVSVASGLKTIEIIKRESIYPKLSKQSAYLTSRFTEYAHKAGLPFWADQEGGMFGFFFSSTPIKNFEEAKAVDTTLFRKFFHLMLELGVYLPPSAFEASFLSTCHSDEDIDFVVEKASHAFKKLRF